VIQFGKTCNSTPDAPGRTADGSTKWEVACECSHLMGTFSPKLMESRDCSSVQLHRAESTLIKGSHRDDLALHLYRCIDWNGHGHTAPWRKRCSTERFGRLWRNGLWGYCIVLCRATGATGGAAGRGRTSMEGLGFMYNGWSDRPRNPAEREGCGAQ